MTVILCTDGDISDDVPEPPPYTADELRGRLMDHFRDMVAYWAGDLPWAGVSPEYSARYRLEGLLHSILVTLDGHSGGFPCSLDLVTRPHPDDKAFYISEGERWIEDGQAINDNVCLHEELFVNNWGVKE